VRKSASALLAGSLLGLPGACGGLGCKASPDQGTIQILTVDDPFTGPPAATEILVEGIAYDDGGLDGAVTTLAEGPLSSATLDLGTYDETTTESLRVTATDSAGTRVAWGETLPLELGAVSGLTLGVFVQRTGALSRLPSPLSDGRPAPLLSVLGGRYIFVAGGTDGTSNQTTNLYDLVSWSPLAAPPTFNFVPESLAVAQLAALAVSSTGAIWLSLSSADSADAAVPAGGTSAAWADISGGATITSTDQSTSFIVGATRTSGAPTSAVLIVSSTGVLTWATLTTPRLGATAAWLDGYGLVIEGGNVTADSTASGVELLAAGSTEALAMAYPIDTTTGAGMTALDGSHLLVVGGATDPATGGAAARVFTVPCKTTACAAAPWSAALPTPLTFAQAFAIDASSAFVVGEDAKGAMHAYRLSATAAVEVPFRVPRSHARAVRLPLGSPGAGPIAVVGGATNIESFLP
jgi:hypothetical protein